MAIIKSRTECCFRNTVEMLINTVAIANAMRQPGEENFLESQPANKEATDPITCKDGHTLVLVSN